MAGNRTNPAWSWIVPLAGWLVMGAALAMPGIFTAALAALALIGAVITAVHHAEVVAHRVGEPFGTLVLAVAVTVIEVALIVSVMLSAGGGKEAIARDTVFAAIMICCNGTGRTTLLQGVAHLAIFAAFLFFAVTPWLHNRFRLSFPIDDHCRKENG